MLTHKDWKYGYSVGAFWFHSRSTCTASYISLARKRAGDTRFLNSETNGEALQLATRRSPAQEIQGLETIRPLGLALTATTSESTRNAIAIVTMRKASLGASKLRRRLSITDLRTATPIRSLNI